MKIFVIGAEGAGKTVFLAMLSRYLNERHGGLVLEPADYRTSQYIVEVQNTLGKGEWPASTRMGQSFVMRYKFGIVGRTNHDLLMHDAAGQDLRSLMLTEDLDNLSAEDKAALAAAKATPGDHMGTRRDQINDADALVYLFDLGSLLASADAHAQNDHCWLLKTFLAHPRWIDKKRIVILSKKDKYEALLAESGNDVRKCIVSHLPSFYRISHYLDQKNVSFVAISSIATETFIDEDGAPSRRPCRPFRPGEMSGVADFLTQVAHRPTSSTAEKGSRRAISPLPKPTGNGFVAMLAALMLPAMLAWLGPAGPNAGESEFWYAVGSLTLVAAVCINPFLAVELRRVPTRAWSRAVFRQCLAPLVAFPIACVLIFLYGFAASLTSPEGASQTDPWATSTIFYLVVILAMAIAVHRSLSDSASQ